MYVYIMVTGDYKSDMKNQGLNKGKMKRQSYGINSQ